MRFLLIGMLAILPGCVSFNWRRDARFTPLPPRALAGLRPGESTLADCLERLGAPLYVWEYKGDGTALAWGSQDVDEKGLTVSIPLQDQSIAPSISYGDGGAELRGVVLLFDADAKLELVREGLLRDLRKGIQRPRPAAVPPTE